MNTQSFKSLLLAFFMGLFTLATLAVANPVMKQADDPLDKIALAIQAGNAKALAAYFDNTVEITIQNDEGVVYSKAQAEQVMKDFFMKNSPTSFKIMHKGSSVGNSMYGIGTMQTSKGGYRVNVFYKKNGADYVIYKLKFTND